MTSTAMRCPKCGGGVRSLSTSSEPEGIRRDVVCMSCDARYMVTKGGLARLSGGTPAPLAPDGEASALLALAKAVIAGRRTMDDDRPFDKLVRAWDDATTPERIMALLTTLTARTAAPAEAEARAERVCGAADGVFAGWKELCQNPDAMIYMGVMVDNLRAALASASPEFTTESGA